MEKSQRVAAQMLAGVSSLSSGGGATQATQAAQGPVIKSQLAKNVFAFVKQQYVVVDLRL